MYPWFKRSILFVLFVGVSLFTRAGTPGFNERTVTVNLAHPTVSQSDLGAMEKDYTLTGEPVGSFATNDITIRRTGETNFQTDSALNLSNNTLTIDGNFTFNGDQAAARLWLDNQGNNAGDSSGFDLTLSGNQLTLKNGVQSDSVGALYGALLHTDNAAPGVGAVSNNTLEVTYSQNNDVYASGLVGGSVQLDMTTYGLGTITSPVPVNVTGNQVTVGATQQNEFNSDIIGGQVLATIESSSGFPDYALNNTLDGNIVTLGSGTFTENKIIGGEARLINTTDAAHHGALSGGVTNNQVNISGGTYNTAVIVGGWADLSGAQYGFDKTSAVSAANNTVTISGGDLHDTLVIGGATTYNFLNQDVLTGNVTGNTIAISGNTNLHGTTTLIGGYTSRPNAGTVSANTLSLATTGLTAYGVDGFSTYEFDVSAAGAGSTFLTVTHGNGHNNSFFSSYERNLKNGAINVEGANFSWNVGGSSARPTQLGLGDDITLLAETSSLGLSGTIANNGAQTDFTQGAATYSYKVIQAGNAVHLLHNGIVTTGDWTQDVNFAASPYLGGDVFLTVGGTLRASNINVSGNSQAAATLTAATLDVTGQNTTLVLNQTAADQVQFNTINVQNGYTLAKSGSGFYSFNVLNIDGSTTQVSGLDAMNAASTVNLSGGAAPNFGIINLGNGSSLTISGGAYDFDTFNVYGQNATLTGDFNAQNKNLNFYLADTTAANDTVLHVTGAADVSGSQIQMGIPGSDSALSKGDHFVLVDAASGMTGDPATLTGVGMQGLLLTYDFDVNVAANQLVATVTKAGLSEESKAFLEGRAASVAFISQGGDFAAQEAMQSAMAAATAREDHSLALFTAFGGGKSRYETGSHVDVTGANASVGLSRAVSIFNADFILASFVEYGTGSYDTYNSFVSGNLKGKGNTEFYGLGALVHYFMTPNSYLDVSLRGGRVSTDFKGNVFFADSAAKYDYDTWYYGGHFGMGYLVGEADDLNLDVYVRYLVNGQQGKSVTISSGDKISFGSAISSRVRVGAKANLSTTDVWRPYVGAALDYEFNAKAKATAYHMSWDAPSLEGASGVGEAGLMWRSGVWSFALGAEGYVGQRRGIRGNVQLGYQF